jgi:hypothetical protein
MDPEDFSKLKQSKHGEGTYVFAISENHMH